MTDTELRAAVAADHEILCKIQAEAMRREYMKLHVRRAVLDAGLFCVAIVVALLVYAVALRALGF